MHRMKIIKAEKLVHEYIHRDEDNQVESIQTALDGVDIEIEKGQFVAILGHNGSGKSTLAKHMNAILEPSGGEMWVDGMDTSDEKHLWDIRQSAGMVFQNPDNQIIASVVEEDVGFGPENIGVPTDEIWERVEESLKAVGMLKFRSHSPNKLSGGQKQRVAIAGVMAMQPECIIFDEPTAMLDPNGRKEVLQAAHLLNQKKGVTVILITHYMEEVVDADRVFVMDKGKVVMQGTPREIFSQVDELKRHRLDVPQITLLADELEKIRASNPGRNPDKSRTGAGIVQIRTQVSEMSIIVDKVNYVYSQGTAYEIQALKNINLKIEDGEFIGIIGHTGSGKSTLIQHLNGLTKATSGAIYYNGADIYDEGYNLKELRSKVGLVFQYPEHQLFETTIFEDVCFGPKNQGLTKEEAELRAFAALKSVGLPEEVYYHSPFDLSGGQKRRVAIAGVLAMQPEVLILDEPTAGLDPKGRDEILDQVAKLHKERGITVILVSHSMEDVAKYVDRIIVMNQGSVMFDDIPKSVFAHYKELEAVGLAAPQVTYLMHELAAAGIPVSMDATTVAEAKEEILAKLGR